MAGQTQHGFDHLMSSSNSTPGSMSNTTSSSVVSFGMICASAISVGPVVARLLDGSDRAAIGGECLHLCLAGAGLDHYGVYVTGVHVEVDLDLADEIGQPGLRRRDRRIRAIESHRDDAPQVPLGSGWRRSSAETVTGFDIVADVTFEDENARGLVVGDQPFVELRREGERWLDQDIVLAGRDEIELDRRHLHTGGSLGGHGDRDRARRQGRDVDGPLDYADVGGDVGWRPLVGDADDDRRGAGRRRSGEHERSHAVASLRRVNQLAGLMAGDRQLCLGVTGRSQDAGGADMQPVEVPALQLLVEQREIAARRARWEAERLTLDDVVLRCDQVAGCDAADGREVDGAGRRLDGDTSEILAGAVETGL